MIYILYLIHVVISIFLILVVLLQQGKGADLSVFGGGGTQAAFGARGAATILHKLTVICFVLFILTTLSIGILQSRSSPSVMGSVAVEETDDASPAPTAPAGGTLPADDEADESQTEDPLTEPESGAAESPSSGGESGDRGSP